MKQFKVGLQLYSVRENMAEDMLGTLKKVKEMGYDYVEFAGYFDHTAEEVKAMLDEVGLECVSVHQVYTPFLEKEQEMIDYLKVIGAKYCAIPWMGPENHKGNEGFDQAIADITKVAKALKENGIQMLYHNHDFEFNKFEDKFLMDWFYESFSEDLMKTEVDCCWVRYAGYDPAEYIKKYTGRSPVVHLKDFICTNFNAGAVYGLIDDSGKDDKPKSKEEAGFMFKPVGHGVQDIPAILKAAEEAGAEIVIVEQDQSPERPALESAKMSREYLKSLGL